MGKRFILNADDFGMDKAINRAVAEAYEFEFLKSVSIVPNGEFFDDAVNSILPNCPDLGVGVHLNVTKGKSLSHDVDKLTNSKSEFCHNYAQILFMSYNSKDNRFLPQLEIEFRKQIEKVKAITQITHIDSHSHIHSIPPIFDLVCKLAKEYGINQVRTHFEKLYIVPDIYRHFNRMFLINFLKKLMLNGFTLVNENTLQKYGLKTNDYLIGTSYGASMDALSVAYGIKGIKYDNTTVEAFIHPCRYDEGTINNRFDEYMIARNKKLADKIIRLGYDITNYSGEQESDKI